MSSVSSSLCCLFWPSTGKELDVDVLPPIARAKNSSDKVGQTEAIICGKPLSIDQPDCSNVISTTEVAVMY